jgi:hypothetical protein
VDFSAKPAGSRLVQFDVGEDSGEILSVTRPAGRQDFFDAGIGEWNGKRYASLIEMRSPNGLPRWKFKDDAIGAGAIVAGNSQLLVAGESYDASQSRASAVVRSFDFAGHLLWHKEFPIEGSSTYIADLAVSDAGVLWILVRSTPLTDNSNSQASFRLLALGVDGHQTKTWSLPLPDRAALWLPPDHVRRAWHARKQWASERPRQARHHITSGCIPSKPHQI